VTVFAEKKRILIWVESLLGQGHLSVINIIAQELVDSSKFDVHIATSSCWRAPELTYGGATLHGYDEALCIDHDPVLGYVTRERGTPIGQDSNWQLRRYERFKNIIEQVTPDAFLIEHWPFARGNLDFEIHRGLMHARNVHPALKVYGSARDVMLAYSGSAGGSAEMAVSIINKCFTKVFVHGDEHFIPFSASFPQATAIAQGKLVHTGYLVRPMPERDLTLSDIRRSIVVSAGGSGYREGRILYETAIAARCFLPDSLRQNPWTIFVSPSYSDDIIQQLEQMASRQSDIHVTRNIARNQFRHAIVNAACSLSLCGRNTAAEVFSSGSPVVFVPSSASKEQQFRATNFAPHGRMEVIAPEEIGHPQILAERICRAVAKRDMPIRNLMVGGEKILTNSISRDFDQASTSTPRFYPVYAIPAPSIPSPALALGG
jgi:predicted glycosyltransferase